MPPWPKVRVATVIARARGRRALSRPPELEPLRRAGADRARRQDIRPHGPQLGMAQDSPQCRGVQQEPDQAAGSFPSPRSRSQFS
jgi:hypothetical protein